MYVVSSIVWRNIIKSDISGIICSGVELINVAPVRVQWRDFVNSVMNHHEEEELLDYICDSELFKKLAAPLIMWFVS